MCQNYFEHVRMNDCCFNGWDADVIIDDFKIAVMWNGPWHRRKITKKHSVVQVQNRDRIKIKEIIACGYIPYVIDDPSNKDKEFVKKEFDKFIAGVEQKFAQRVHTPLSFDELEAVSNPATIIRELASGPQGFQWSLQPVLKPLQEKEMVSMGELLGRRSRAWL